MYVKTSLLLLLAHLKTEHDNICTGMKVTNRSACDRCHFGIKLLFFRARFCRREWIMRWIDLLSPMTYRRVHDDTSISQALNRFTGTVGHAMSPYDSLLFIPPLT